MVVVRDRDIVEARRLGAHRILDELAWPVLLRHQLVAELDHRSPFCHLIVTSLWTRALSLQYRIGSRADEGQASYEIADATVTHLHAAWPSSPSARCDSTTGSR